MKNISDTHHFYDKNHNNTLYKIYCGVLCIAVIVKTNESKKKGVV